jgi:hypothetical protein
MLNLLTYTLGILEPLLNISSKRSLDVSGNDASSNEGNAVETSAVFLGVGVLGASTFTSAGEFFFFDVT